MEKQSGASGPSAIFLLGAGFAVGATAYYLYEAASRQGDIQSEQTAWSTVSAAASAGGKKLGSVAPENVQWRPAGIENVVKAMVQNIDEFEVQTQGCLALKNLAISNQANQVEIAKQGGITAVVKAMVLHSSQGVVQEQGCGALWNLAAVEANRVEIAKQGGIEAIVKALVQHPDNTGVQEQALLSLACNDTNRVEICKQVRIAAVVTLFSARHLPHIDGMFGTCDAFIEVVYKDKTLKSSVHKKSLDPDWKPEEKFEFDLSSGELADIEIQLKDWNMTTSAKLLGTTVIGVDALKRLLAGDKAAFPSDEFLITAPDGKPLTGKDQKQAHLVLKVGVVVDKSAAEKAAAEQAAADAKAAAEATARAAVEAKAKVDTAAAAASEKAAAEKEFELSITSRPEAGTSSAQSGRYDSLLDTSLISPTRP